MIDIRTYDLSDGDALQAAFHAALDNWRSLARNAALQRGQHSREFATAFTTSAGSSDPKRKADADAQTASLAIAADQADAEARAARFQVEFLIGLAGGRTIVER